MSLGLPLDLDRALGPILNTVLDAVIVMTKDGRIRAWNSVAEQTFGWSSKEAVGQMLSDMLVPNQHRFAHEKGLSRLNAGGEPRVLNRRIEISALCKDGREIPVELSITTASSGSNAYFVGFLRDITERRAAEDRLAQQAIEARLMFDIAHMAADAESFDAALEKTLRAICTITGWPVGHAFAVEGDAATLVSTPIWIEQEPGAALKLQSATEVTAFGPGIGLPGRILQTGEPLWISDTDNDAVFARRGTGFGGAFGFPLKHEGRIIAILEFFAKTPTPPDAALLLTVRALGEQVGRVFERKRTQDRQQLLLHELNHRVKNILTVVQAIAQQTFRKSANIGEASAAFSSRLIALSNAQNLLVAGHWGGAPLKDVVEAALTGCGGAGERCRLSGPELQVTATNAVSISLAVHELCTNAFKYGALSVETGSVEISWEREVGDGCCRLQFEWREKGGPPVAPPVRAGFGTALLERGLTREMGGEVELLYEATGLICRFTAPLLQP